MRGRVKRGVRRDDDGELVTVLAFPMYAGGKIAGVGVFSRNLQAAVDDFKKNDKSEVFILRGRQAEISTIGDGQESECPPRHRANAVLDGRIGDATTRSRAAGAGCRKPLAHLRAPTFTPPDTKEGGDHLDRHRAVLLVIGAAIGMTFCYMTRAFRPLNAVIASVNAIAQATAVH